MKERGNGERNRDKTEEMEQQDEREIAVKGGKERQTERGKDADI